MTDTKITGTITHITRMSNSRMGNPRWHVSFVDADGTFHAFPTESDASVAYGLDNPEFKGTEVEFTIRRGQIVHAEPLVYVVTFSREKIAGPGALDSLRRVTWTEAHAILREAAHIPKHGRIVNAQTLEIVGA